MSRVDTATVKRLADLARVGLPEARIPQLVAELNDILEHMDALSAVDGARATADEHVPVGMPLRPDVVRAPADITPLAAVAPQARDGFILVPRLGSHDDAG
jgi:aspartyl-tRNA(Asn)/glutamyl-tRNA(Gln) amidotransferase subunit C